MTLLGKKGYKSQKEVIMKSSLFDVQSKEGKNGSRKIPG